MTDFDAATASRSSNGFAAFMLTAALTFGLAGCETAGNILGGGSDADAKPPAPVAAAAPKAQLAKVSIAPIVGTPDAISRQLSAQLTQSAERNRISIVTGSEVRADYTVRGYVVAARDKAGAKVQYIWDVFDPSGKRVNRISGEEIAAGAPNAKDPWASVTPALTQTIADKSAASLAAWLPTQPAPGAAPPVANALPAASSPPAAAGAGSIQPQQQAARTPASTNTTTAALPRGDQVTAEVPKVTGAPGDGNVSLSSALQRELSRQGVELASRPGITHRVQGRVALGQMKDGKQPIQIDWQVLDPQGKSLGTVSQKNEIQPGLLDGEWGKTADAAAAAAAQGIIKLLPQAKATN